jgi:hypothetical protein
MRRLYLILWCALGCVVPYTCYEYVQLNSFIRNATPLAL